MKYLVFLVMLCCGINVNAENIPFVQDGKRWKATYYWGALNDHLGVKHRYHYDFLLEGDTIINDEACKKMYVDSSLDGSRKEYLLSMYQREQKVFFVPKDSQEGLLLYDFGAEVGDIIEVFTGPSINPAQSSYQYSPVEMRVLDVEMRMYHGVERRCLYVINESDYQSYVDDDEPFTLEDLMPESGWWIEGLGKEGYPFDNTQVGMMMGGGMSTWLCTVGTDTLYTNGTFDPTANQCLADGGMSWIQEYSPGNSVSPEYRKVEKRHFYFKWDEERVLIGGHQCRNLYASVLGEETDEHIMAALYEEDGKVWFYPWKGSEDAYLLYDFHANEGDVLTVGVLDYWDDFQEERDVQQRKCKVEKVTEEEFKGIKRRCLYLNEACNEEGEFSTDRSGESFCWIKGIGSLLGIEGNLPGAGMAGTPHRKLLDCSWMDDVYYHDGAVQDGYEVQDLILREVDSYKEEAFYYEFVDDKLHLYGNVKTGLADGIALQCIIYDDIVDIAPIESPDMLVTTPSMYRADAWFNVVESDVKMVTYKGKQIEERNYQEAPYMTEMSAEGVPIRFCVLDEINKTCMVGVGDYDSPAIDANIRGAVTIPSMVDGYFVKKVCAKAFASCAIDSLIIPEGVKVIGAEMVDGCANLKHITIPSSAEWIGPQAFYTGYDLSSVVTYIREPSMLWPAKYVFTTSGDTDLGINHCANATLYVPLDTKKEYQQYRDWKQFAHIVEMETDKIQDVHIDKRSQHAKEVYFDLTGRHVTTPTKGMYIRNGKKVLVK